MGSPVSDRILSSCLSPQKLSPGLTGAGTLLSEPILSGALLGILLARTVSKASWGDSVRLARHVLDCRRAGMFTLAVTLRVYGSASMIGRNRICATGNWSAPSSIWP